MTNEGYTGPVVQVSLNPPHGRPAVIEFPLLGYWHLYRIMSQMNPADVEEVAVFGYLIGTDGKGTERHRVRELMRALRPPRLESLEDALLDFTYEVLKDKKTNYAAAADLVSKVTQQKVTAEAWRKRIQRWADKAGRDRLELRGRPKTGQPNT
jgi:hypothetical protein